MVRSQWSAVSSQVSRSAGQQVSRSAGQQSVISRSVISRSAIIRSSVISQQVSGQLWYSPSDGMEPERLWAASLAESRECIEPADDAELTSLNVGDTEREPESPPAGRRPADSRRPHRPASHQSGQTPTPSHRSNPEAPGQVQIVTDRPQGTDTAPHDHQKPRQTPRRPRLSKPSQRGSPTNHRPQQASQLAQKLNDSHTRSETITKRPQAVTNGQ